MDNWHAASMTNKNPLPHAAVQPARFARLRSRCGILCERVPLSNKEVRFLSGFCGSKAVAPIVAPFDSYINIIRPQLCPLFHLFYFFKLRKSGHNSDYVK
ncbi:hypothetical protein EZS27_029331 [termite gut metagenome]|uniref:Uncharacterized protein n=1 Tax=termite gut metagenome TaxID=433724 RepID=A0A5J4QK73_9ZZZZ